jgi:sulfur transfer protein SufE
VNKTCQQRYVTLQKQAIFFYKSEKALRSRGFIPLYSLSIKEEVPESIADVLATEMYENIFVLSTPWRDFKLWMKKLNGLEKLNLNMQQVIKQNIIFLYNTLSDYLWYVVHKKEQLNDGHS